jgi:REP element-mobilizing transposase RayT
MLLGYHISFSAYGFWLPNDPRGSGSDHVDAEHLSEFGRPLQVDRSRSVASNQHDDELRRKAKSQLKYPAIKFNGEQALTVALAFGDVATKLDVLVHACAVLPDHVHLVTGVAAMKSELLRHCFKRAATRRLNAADMHPLGELRKENGRVPSPWGEKGWNVFINSKEQMRRVIHYVEENPVKAGLKQQRWSFVTAFEQ